MNQRLDSWKAIAEYLRRDTATVRRWEKTLGLPVRRVAGGPGRSVFAYTDDIDAWLATGPQERPAAEPDVADDADLTPVPGEDAPVPANPEVPARRAVATWAIAIVVLLVVLGTAAWVTHERLTRPPHSAVATAQGVIAYDDAGRERWRYQFPSNTQTALPAFGEAAVVIEGAPPNVIVSTSHRYHATDGPVDGGELIGLDASGRAVRKFSFDDEIAMRGSTFGVPWVITGFTVTRPAAPREIAVAAHHFLWSPSLVTILDQDWHRTATYVHDGWLETLGWAGPQRLIAGGFEQEQDGGVVVLLDTTTMQPIRMVVMPRTELNVVSASRFNRANVEIVNGHVLVRTIEMPLELSQGAIDVIYEYSPELTLERASLSDRYWEVHRALEVQGKLHHTRAQCPERLGPRDVLVWEKATGWRAQPIAVHD
jgi:hypothetical protein